MRARAQSGKALARGKELEEKIKDLQEEKVQLQAELRGRSDRKGSTGAPATPNGHGAGPGSPPLSGGRSDPARLGAEVAALRCSLRDTEEMYRCIPHPPSAAASYRPPYCAHCCSRRCLPPPTHTP